jgi:penicillin-binding protein 1A
VQTTLDLGLQRSAEQAVGRWLGNPPSGPHAALVAIDNDTGEVRAMVGGSDYSRVPFNLATQGQRQPGSAFKPFVLATALRQGIGPGSTWTSRKIVFDVPNSSEKFAVNNYENNYSGVSTLARATTFSDNAVYAQVGVKTGTKRIARTAERMGIRTPVSTNYAITLGGLRNGVTPLDLAHAYETLATGGVLVTGSLGAPKRGPVGIRKVSLRDSGRVWRRNKRKRVRVLPRNVADTTTSILESVVRVGTGRVANLGAVRAWGKTGTTENYGDAWFVGATDKLSVAVWVGYPDGLTPMTTEYRGEPVAGGTLPAHIWHDFMVAALAIDKERLKRECAAAQKKLEGDDDAPPPQSCVKAGVVTDPDKQEGVPATDGQTGTTPAGPGAEPEAGTGDDAPAPADEEPAEQAPDPPAPDPQPGPQPAPVPAPVPVPQPGGATPSGGASPEPEP